MANQPESTQGTYGTGKRLWRTSSALVLTVGTANLAAQLGFLWALNSNNEGTVFIIGIMASAALTFAAVLAVSLLPGLIAFSRFPDERTTRQITVWVAGGLLLVFSAIVVMGWALPFV